MNYHPLILRCVAVLAANHMIKGNKKPLDAWRKYPTEKRFTLLNDLWTSPALVDQLACNDDECEDMGGIVWCLSVGKEYYEAGNTRYRL